jgi:uncharacterized membrane protein YczE
MKPAVPHARSSRTRVVRLVAGLWLFALGVVMTLRAELGLSPWDVLADGLRQRTPLTFGTAVILIGVVLVAVEILLGVRPGPGTIANMVLIGVFEDLMLATGWGAGLGQLAWFVRAPLLLAGVVTIGLGSALYIGAEMGAGPRDGLMILAAGKLTVRIGIARALVEGSALLAGALLGGRWGIGTLLFAVGIGPAVDLWFRLFGLDEAGRRLAPGP